MSEDEYGINLSGVEFNAMSGDECGFCGRDLRPEPEIALWPAALLLFYGWSLSGPFSLGKLVVTGLIGVWLVLGGVYRLGWGPLFYLAVMAWTTVFSSDPWLSVFHLWGTNNAGLLAAFSLVPFWTSVKDCSEIEQGIRIGGVILAMIGLLQLFGLFLPYPISIFSGRVYSLAGSPVYLGAELALCFPFCPWWGRALLGLCLLATGSRGAWVAVGCSMIYLYWPHFSVRWRTWGIVAVGTGLILALWLRPVSDMGRVVTWAAAWEAFKTRPWLGWGPATMYNISELWHNPAWVEACGPSLSDHAHNLFLEALATSGILGLVGLVVFLYVLFTNAGRLARSALIGVFICGLLNPLPMAVKALCLSISVSPTRNNVSVFSARVVKGTSAIIFLMIMWLVHLDRMVTFYGDVPWGFNAARAAWQSGILKQPIVRKDFKL